MNTKTQEALKLALEALEWCVEQGGGPECEHQNGGVVCFCKEKEAITAIREALAEQPSTHRHISYVCPQCYWSLEEQPAQEPVAWVVQYAHDHKDIDFYETDIEDLPVGTKLYTSPPASKPWVGLTDEEFQWIYDNGRTPAGMIEMAEAKLRGKNA